ANDAVSANDSATKTGAVTRDANLSITKTAASDPVSAGNNETYTITVHNNGPSNAGSFSAADVLPAGTSFVSATNGATYDAGTNTVGFGGASLANGAEAAFNLTVAVSAAYVPGNLANTAGVSSANDAVSANDSATKTVAVTRDADLSITKTAATDPV